MSNAQNPTWTLSGFGDEIDPDPKVQAAVLLALGASHIEVRSAWGVNVVELSDAQLAELKEILDGAGLKVSAVASPIGKVDASLPAAHEVERLRRIIEVAKALDTTYIRMFSFFRAEDKSPEDIRDAVMERLTLLAAEAEKAGVVLIHENEKDIYGDTPERVLDILETVNSPALRAAWDNANFVQVGVKPYTDAYAMLRPYLEYLQVKDAIAGSGEVVPDGPRRRPAGGDPDCPEPGRLHRLRVPGAAPGGTARTGRILRPRGVRRGRPGIPRRHRRHRRHPRLSPATSCLQPTTSTRQRSHHAQSCRHRLRRRCHSPLRGHSRHRRGRTGGRVRHRSGPAGGSVGRPRRAGIQRCGGAARDGGAPDVVHVCTPHNQHADPAIAALERGINVISEKPLASTLADGERLAAAAAASSARIGVCFQNRYNQAVAAMARAARLG